MKILFFILLVLISCGSILSQWSYNRWGEYNPPIPLKKIDLNSSFVIGSNVNFFQFDALIYPVSLFFNDKTKHLDYGIGGGISLIEPGKVDPYVKILLNKDWKTNAMKNSRWGNDIYSNYLFNSKQFALGINMSYTKGISDRIFLKLKLGPAYYTGINSLVLNSTIAVGLEGAIQRHQVKKPVVYFYPNDTLDLKLKLNFDGDLSFCYPEFEESWDLTVYPNSFFKENKTNKTYPYLFWEGEYDLANIDVPNEGSIVNSDSLTSFFETSLTNIGLNRREITDFITFWVPSLNKEKYLVQFVLQEDCNAIASYDFSEEPDTFIRIIALFTPVESFNKSITPQTFKNITRNGFTVVEWGGIEIPQILN